LLREYGGTVGCVPLTLRHPRHGRQPAKSRTNPAHPARPAFEDTADGRRPPNQARPAFEDATGPRARTYPATPLPRFRPGPDETRLVSRLDKLRQHGGNSLVSLQFLLIFPLPPDKKSVSFRLTLGADDRTLTAEEVTRTRERVVEGIKAAGYELRE